MLQSTDTVETAVATAGFTPLGWIPVEADDAVPDLAGDRKARCLLLVGNAGPAMWQRFAAERISQGQTLDEWSSSVLTPLADRLGASVYYPFSRPYMPFQRWAKRSGHVHASPLGMSIHHTFGLWHAYRAAFVFARPFDLPVPPEPASPCDMCRDKPCLATCPVSAFDGTRYDVDACAGHLGTSAGADCVDLGCRARRACPVGREYIYAPAQARFHMSAFLKART